MRVVMESLLLLIDALHIISPVFFFFPGLECICGDQSIATVDLA